MKKISIFLVIMLLGVSLVYAQTAQEIQDCYTDGLMNGRTFTIPQLKDFAVSYIFGIVDGSSGTDPKLLRGLYSDATKQDIVNAVMAYYSNNPTKRHRSIVEVIFSGCK